MTKEREKAYFQWQRSFNNYIVLLTIILFLVSILDKLNPIGKSLSLWALGIAISLFGIAIVSLNADELVYVWKHLRDKRPKVTLFQKYSSLAVYTFINLVGLLVTFFGIYILLVLSGLIGLPPIFK